MSEFQVRMLLGAAIYFLTAFVCVAAWAYVLSKVLNYFKLKKHGKTASATITDIVNGHIKVEYTAEGTGKVTHTSRSDGFGKEKYPVGTKVDVYYDPSAPEKNTVIKGSDIYEHLTALIMASVILPLFTAGLVSAAAYHIVQFLGYK